MRNYHQRLPNAGPEREALREKGQFWTPDWIAEAMVGYVALDGSPHIFDPAVGAGAFFRAAKIIEQETGRKLQLLGTEIDPSALEQARQNGLSREDFINVQITDFVLCPPKRSFKAIVANPPYIRHHRLSSDVKKKLKAFGASLIGTALDGRAGLHIYFLLRALQLLDKDGRLAFIMPADTCEGIFSRALWDWITEKYRLQTVITFSPEASPFPNVDTNPIIFMIENTKPRDHLSWLKCASGRTHALKKWIFSELENPSSDEIMIYRRQLTEALTTGLSRPPNKEMTKGPILADFASVLRGIATGSNDFFFLTTEQTTTLGIPDEFLIPAIGRTRDIPGNEITSETLRELDFKGRPTLLFSPDGRSINEFPKPVIEYLRKGEEMGIHKKSLISTRRPWYKMEVRAVPPILFAYLGRRNVRFIRNLAGVIPLTSFLCVYPHQEDITFINRLWQVLQHPKAISDLWLVGKSYGAGAVKVEPRSLEKLPLPKSIVSKVNLQSQILMLF